VSNENAASKFGDIAAERRVRVSFDAEVLLIGDEVPETLDSSTLAQAVQDTTGYTGISVVAATFWTVEQ